MDNQKLENLLNLALQTPEPYREKSLQLNVGFDPLLQEWEVIIRYIGNCSRFWPVFRKFRPPLCWAVSQFCACPSS